MKLAQERQKKGLSVEALAKLTALSVAVIKEIESGKTKGAPSTLKRLKAALAAYDTGQERMDMFPVVKPARQPQPLSVSFRGAGPWEGRFTSPPGLCGFCGRTHARGKC